MIHSLYIVLSLIHIYDAIKSLPGMSDRAILLAHTNRKPGGGFFLTSGGKRIDDSESVSYTHLDVYKRQRRPHDADGKQGLRFAGAAGAGNGRIRNCLLYTSRCV